MSAPRPQSGEASPQRQAADPAVSAFVTANAGSGKTTTLVNRVARLLLRGASPSAILCVTYTKAAASEMQRRLFETLGGWAVADDEGLAAELVKLGEAPGDLSRARVLFAKALETPGGLKIQTLHAFSEALLRRFPLEAGVAPGFTVLDDAEAATVSRHARERLADLALAAPHHPVALAYAHFAVELDLGAFEGLLSAIEANRLALQHWFDRHGGAGGAIDDVWARSDFGAPSSVEAVAQEVLAATDWAQWRRVADAIATGGKQDQSVAKALRDALACTAEHPERLAQCWQVFSTKDGEARARRSLTTQAMPGWAAEWLLAEQARLQAAMARLASVRVAEDTAHAVALAAAYVSLYEGEKDARGALDFPDLVRRAVELLTERADAAWVLYKLDGGIEHVLLDEAQDTAPEQWAMMQALTSEFFAGAAGGEARGMARTVFAVGDEKQSIYGFQGARPERLRVEIDAYRRSVRGAGLDFATPALLESYRSTPEVLRFVDAVFAPDAMRAAVPAPAGETTVAHRAVRPPGHGAVDLWPLVQEEAAITVDAWDALDAEPKRSARRRLAEAVAKAVKHIVEADSVIDKDTRQPRPAHPGDVLILVRKRDAVFEELIRALKQERVPVAGADKLTLSNHILFQDVLALIRIALFPSDDLTLAAVLRSPFCTVDEDALFDLAHRRTGSLWGELHRRASERPEWAEAVAFLGWARAEAERRTPFDFLGRVLSFRDGGGLSMRQRLLTRLGAEAEDALDELVAEALAAEGRGVLDLERFAAALEHSAVQVKRQLDGAVREVRVMTVHGAKGLEAPIVVLPDAALDPPRSKATLIPTEDGDFLFAPRQGDDSALSKSARADLQRRQDQESLRLLYVALTRARDRIIVGGRLGVKRSAPNDASWYAHVERAFDRPEIAAEVRSIQGDVRRFGADPSPRTAAVPVPAAAALPAWAVRDPIAEAPAPRRGSPSNLGAKAGARAPSPLARTPGGLGRYRRGDLIHSLLERLPDVAPERRDAAAMTMLARQRDLSDDQRQEMIAAALGVLHDDRFAAVFGPGSVAEAAIAGGAPELPADLRISGRIDRMTVTADRVLVVDFKTNRPAPHRIEDADPAYIRQMAVYRAVLAAIYPDRRVEAALVWTDGPRLMPVPENLILQALERLRLER